MRRYTAIAGLDNRSKARPMQEDWVRNIRNACQKYNLRFFYKQRLGNGKKITLPELDGQV